MSLEINLIEQSFMNKESLHCFQDFNGPSQVMSFKRSNMNIYSSCPGDDEIIYNKVQTRTRSSSEDTLVYPSMASTVPRREEERINSTENVTATSENPFHQDIHSRHKLFFPRYNTETIRRQITNQSEANLKMEKLKSFERLIMEIDSSSFNLLQDHHAKKKEKQKTHSQTSSQVNTESLSLEEGMEFPCRKKLSILLAQDHVFPDLKFKVQQALLSSYHPDSVTLKNPRQHFAQKSIEESEHEQGDDDTFTVVLDSEIEEIYDYYF